MARASPTIQGAISEVAARHAVATVGEHGTVPTLSEILGLDLIVQVSHVRTVLDLFWAQVFGISQTEGLLAHKIVAGEDVPGGVESKLLSTSAALLFATHILPIKIRDVIFEGLEILYVNLFVEFVVYPVSK